jgi:GTP-binding protein Era
VTRCGIAAVIGEPNAGKSTLVNALTGSKISIVTPKAQTTRFNVRGIFAHDGAQIVLTDTPGIFEAPKAFEQAMVRAAWSGARDADGALLIVDATKGVGEAAERIAARLQQSKKPSAAALNKIDRVKKPQLLALATQLADYGFERVFMISALKGDGLDEIKAWLAGQMPEGPWLYPADQMSDVPLRLLAAEITREKLFMKLEQELPYAAFVETEHWEEEGGRLKISQVIYVERETQKKIVIGKGGEMLKAIGTAARRELETLMGKKLHLALFVKVKPWRDRPEHFRDLGLEFKP